MWIRATRCPKCRNRLVFESIGSYGDIYDLSARTGIIAKNRKRREHYNKEDSMVYCEACGTSYEHKQCDNYAVEIWYDDEEGTTK